MKKKIFILGLGLILSVTGCSFSLPESLKSDDQEKEKESEEESNDKKLTFTVNFYQDELLKSTVTAEPGSKIYDEPSIQLIADDYYTYTFLGWDSNNDGIRETFPYTVNCDTNFKLLYSKESVIYHYDIYVNNELIKSVDTTYNSTIDYPDVQSYWVGENPYIFVGWKYDGVYDGLRKDTITKSCRIDAVFANGNIIKAYYGAQIYAVYLEKGKTVNPSALFPAVTAESGYTIKWYTDEFYQSPYTSSTMPDGNLNLYARSVSNNETQAPKYISNKNNLLFEFNVMILNRVYCKNFIINLDMSLDDIVLFFNANALSIYSYSYSLQLLANELTISIEFEEIATTKIDTVDYIQVDSFNVQSFTSARDESFDNFKYKSRTNEFYVDTSDALFYALENGYLPVINETNTQLLSLFNKMKNALRSCVDDSMDDATKARKIYEYIILNTTYDSEVAKIAENSSKYNSFYLEGVFNDNLAVCDGISKAYSCLCNMEGIECHRITGQTVKNVGHAWNKIKINNKYYVVDATAGGTIASDKEYLSYSYFMITDSLYSQHANQYDSYDGLYITNTSYDVYEDMNVSISDTVYSLKASSREQAAKIFKYFNDNRDTSKTMSFDLEISYSYSTLSEEILSIQNEAGFSGKITYLSGIKGVTIIL